MLVPPRSKATKVRALESGYENLGLSDATLQVHIVKPSGVHNRYMCTENVYREYKHICVDLKAHHSSFDDD